MTDNQIKPDPDEDSGISTLYQATRHEVPSAELDAKILAEAQVVARGRRRRWLVPLSSAAVVLLGLTFTLRLVDQAPRLPQTGEDFSTELPAEIEVIPRAEKKQVLPKPAMMMDSLPGRAKEEGVKLRKAAPRSSVPSPNKVETFGDMDLYEALESDNQALKSVEMEDTPADWLARIEMYLDKGDRAKAIQELKAFMFRYPDYSLPKALEELDLD